jgi:hypothetical protein
MMEIMVLLELLLYYILNTQKFSLMPVYGEGASNVCRPTAISGALATASAGEVDDDLRHGSRRKNRTANRSKSRTGIEVVFSQWMA